MTTPFDNSLYARSRALIQKYGLAATLEVVTSSDYDASTGEITKTTSSIPVLVSPPSKTDEVSGSSAVSPKGPSEVCFLILVTDLVANAPRVGQFLILDSVRRLITGVTTYRTGTLSPVYRVMLES